MDYLRDLTVFVRVVERQGFAAAGRELGLSASTVSKHVARLEKQIGVRLLHRTTHHLFLTDAGNEFYRGCVQGLGSIESARAAATSLAEDVKGGLRIHSTPGIGQTLIAPALLDFMALHPDIWIELEMGSPGVNPMEHRFDIAFRIKNLRERSPGHSSIRRRFLGRVHYAVVAAPAYLDRFGRPERPEDLRHHRGLVHRTQALAEEWRFRTGRNDHQAVRIEAVFRSNNWQAVREAAMRGLGIARLPQFAVAEQVAAGELVSLFDGTIPAGQQVQALFPHTPQMPAKLRLLLDFFVERLTGRQALAREEERAPT